MKTLLVLPPPGKKIRKKNKVTLHLKFNNKIYNNAGIRNAISTFSDFAKFKLNNTKDYFQVVMEEINFKDKNMLIDEFSNYALGASKNAFGFKRDR